MYTSSQQNQPVKPGQAPRPSFVPNLSRAIPPKPHKTLSSAPDFVPKLLGLGRHGIGIDGWSKASQGLDEDYVTVWIEYKQTMALFPVFSFSCPTWSQYQKHGLH